MRPEPLHLYDWIVVNSSGGKDSQSMLDEVVQECDLARVDRDRIVVVHADLGRHEWKGTKELAQRQAEHYGLRFVIVKSSGLDLLARVRHRQKWPDSARRWCTSDLKRSPVSTLHTALARATRDLKGPKSRALILNCLGMRAQESPARKKLPAFEHGDCGKTGKPTQGTSKNKRIDTWHPILDWSVDQVWDRIRSSGVPYHRAYDLGMPRLSCCFCIFATKSALMVAGKHNPELLQEYVQVESEVNHSFRQGFKIAEIQDALAVGETVADTIEDWNA